MAEEAGKPAFERGDSDGREHTKRLAFLMEDRASSQAPSEPLGDLLELSPRVTFMAVRTCSELMPEFTMPANPSEQAETEREGVGCDLAVKNVYCSCTKPKFRCQLLPDEADKLGLIF